MNKTKTVWVRFQALDFEYLRKQAEEEGTSVSAIVRRIIRSQIKKLGSQKEAK